MASIPPCLFFPNSLFLRFERVTILDRNNGKAFLPLVGMPAQAFLPLVGMPAHHFSCIKMAAGNPSSRGIAALYNESFNDEDLLGFLKEYVYQGRENPDIQDDINPLEYHPANLYFGSSSKKYYYAEYVEERDSMNNGWRRCRGEEKIRDMSQICGYKQYFMYLDDGHRTNWTMTKYFLYDKKSKKNQSVIYVVSKQW